MTPLPPSANSLSTLPPKHHQPLHPPSYQTLYDLVLPGTHDSAAFLISPHAITREAWKVLHYRPLRNLLQTTLRDFSRTQSLDFYEQLRSGNRFFDLRISKLADTQDDHRFWTVHGQLACVPLDKFFEDVNRFHGERISAGGEVEPVVTTVRFFNLRGDEVGRLCEEFKECLQHDYFVGCADELRTTPVAELPPNIVVGVPGLSKMHDYKVFAADDWINTYCPRKKLEGLREQVCTLARPRKERNNLYVLGFTVTPHFWDFFTRIVSFGRLRPSLDVSANRMNAHCADFINQHRSPLKERVNVIFFDFFTKSQAAFVESLNDTDLPN